MARSARRGAPSECRLGSRMSADGRYLRCWGMRSAPVSEIGLAVLLVTLGGRQYGLPLECVERVMPMAEVLSLPDTGDGLLGMLNMHGQVLPVINIYPRLGLPTPRLAAAQRLVLLRASVPFLMWVDDVEEVVVGRTMP